MLIGGGVVLLVRSWSAAASGRSGGGATAGRARVTELAASGVRRSPRRRPAVGRRRSYGRYVAGQGARGAGQPVLRPGGELLPVPGAARRPGPHAGPRPVPDRGAARGVPGEYGLDQPLPQQFLTYLKNTFTGDLGVSLRYRVPVSDLILDRLWPTLLLVGTSTLLATRDRRLPRHGQRLEPRQGLRPGLHRHAR